MKRIAFLTVLLGLAGCGVRVSPQKVTLTDTEYTSAGKPFRVRRVESVGTGVKAPKGTDISKLKLASAKATMDRGMKEDEGWETMGSEGGKVNAKLVGKAGSWLLYAMGGLLLAGGILVAGWLKKYLAGGVLAAAGIAVLAIAFYPALALWLAIIALGCVAVVIGYLVYQAYKAGTLQVAFRRVIAGIEDVKGRDPTTAKVVTDAIGAKDADGKVRDVVTKERKGLL